MNAKIIQHNLRIYDQNKIVVKSSVLIRRVRLKGKISVYLTFLMFNFYFQYQKKTMAKFKKSIYLAWVTKNG